MKDTPTPKHTAEMKDFVKDHIKLEKQCAKMGNEIYEKSQQIEKLTAELSKLKEERKELIERLEELYKFSPDIPVPLGTFEYGLAKAIKDAFTLLQRLKKIER